MSDSGDVKCAPPEKLVEKSKISVPENLKIVKVEDVGEKSPNADSVYDLCMIYGKRYPKDEVKKDGAVNVHLDQMPTEVQTGFLEKLKKLSVGNKESTEESFTSSAGRFIKNLVQRRSNWKGKQGSAEKGEDRFDNFGRPSKRNVPRNMDKPRKKDAARRLNFNVASGDSAENRTEQSLGQGKVKSPPDHDKNSRPYKTSRASVETSSDTSSKNADSYESLSSHPTSSRRDRRSCSTGDRLNGKSRGIPRGRKENPFQANWTGELPPRDYTSPTFSRKIFVGGVPWDITEAALKESFGEFGSCAVEWPGQEARYRSGQHPGGLNNNARHNAKVVNGPAATGYVYMIFEDERAVGLLLNECSQEIGGAGEWYFKIRAQRSKSTEIRQVQIIPWVTSDSLHCNDLSILEYGAEPKRTVFVGALHGMMTAQVLHSIMEDCFGTVEYVQLDTDKFKYPIGSGRVTFSEHGAYFKAIEFGYLLVHTSKFKKRVQIDPFLESTACMVCGVEAAHCFCRNKNCFKYYCNTCWAADHKQETPEVHIPVIVPSSATKPFTPSNRRMHMYPNVSPIKAMASMSAPNQSTYHQQQAPFVVAPMIVGHPPPPPNGQALPAMYGYPSAQMSVSQSSFITSASQSVSNQSFDSHPESYSYDRKSNRTLSVSSMNGLPNGPLFVNPGIITPQKKTMGDQQLGGFYGNGNFGQTTYLSPVLYATTANSSPISNTQLPITTAAGQFYGGNYFYGYLAPMNGNGNTSPMIYHDGQNNCNMYH